MSEPDNMQRIAGAVEHLREHDISPREFLEVALEAADRPYGLDDMLEALYDLDRKELRRLAYEALLISDGPDHIEGDVADAAINVVGTCEVTAMGPGPVVLFEVWLSASGPQVLPMRGVTEQEKK